MYIGAIISTIAAWFVGLLLDANVSPDIIYITKLKIPLLKKN